MALEPKPMRIGSGFDKYHFVIATVCGIVVIVTIWIACGGLT